MNSFISNLVSINMVEIVETYVNYLTLLSRKASRNLSRNGNDQIPLSIVTMNDIKNEMLTIKNLSASYLNESMA
jgi:hypothetical protein